jgi:hypothetical protein
MKIPSKARFPLVVFVAVVSVFTAVPANATTGAGVVAGTGSFSPGLTQPGGQQTVTFGVTGALATTGNAGEFTCTFAGDSGGFGGSCTVPCGAIGISGSYTIVDLEMAWTGAIVSGCTGPSTFAGDCPLVPTSAPSETSYATVCDLNFDGLAGAVVIAGTGTIFSGFGPPTFTFSGTGVGTAAAQNGGLNCTANGNDTVGTLTVSIGSFSGSCGVPCGAVAINGSYVRDGLEMTMDGTIGGGCMPPSTFTAICSYTPVGALVVTSFALACGFTLS